MQNKEYQKDTSLLRPFDLEAAKDGCEICWSHIPDTVSFVGATSKGIVAYESEGQYGFTSQYNLRMKPLAWVEGKPVYKGDILWYNGYNFSIVVSGLNDYDPEHGLKGVVNYSDGKNPCCYVGNGNETTWAPFASWTWNKPKQKVKRKVWINIYPEDSANVCSAYWNKEYADKVSAPTRIAFVETEIEYEVQ